MGEPGEDRVVDGENDSEEGGGDGQGDIAMAASQSASRMNFTNCRFS